MAYNLFIDTNIYLDVLLHRGADWHHAEALLFLAEQKTITAYTSASNLLNLLYVLRTEKVSRTQIIYHETGILGFTTLANPDNSVFQTALHSSFTDLEDAVQYYTALSIPGIDYFITSNLKDFKKAVPALPVITPKAFMNLWQNSINKAS